MTLDFQAAYNAVDPPIGPTARMVADIVLRCAADLARINPGQNDAQVYVNQMEEMCLASIARNMPRMYV